VFFTPGEIAAGAYGAYLTNATITGLFAQEIRGAVVMVEREQHVFLSNPKTNKIMQTDFGVILLHIPT
jgi:hypothetical protein